MSRRKVFWPLNLTFVFRELSPNPNIFELGTWISFNPRVLRKDPFPIGTFLSHQNKLREWPGLIVRRVLCWVCGSHSRHNQQLGVFHINTCATCDLPYNSWNNHKRHVQEAHGGVMRVRCPQCAKIFQVWQLAKFFFRFELQRNKSHIRCFALVGGRSQTPSKTKILVCE